MSHKSQLWVRHKTKAKTLTDLVPYGDLVFVAEFLHVLRTRPQLMIPKDSAMTLFKADGTTEIETTEVIEALNSAKDHPLVVTVIAPARSEDGK
jgi:hypothetical protein